MPQTGYLISHGDLLSQLWDLEVQDQYNQSLERALFLVHMPLSSDQVHLLSVFFGVCLKGTLISLSTLVQAYTIEK